MTSSGLRSLPPFVLNSIPKSGTHLVKQILQGIPGMQHHPDKGMFGHFDNQGKLQLDRVEALSDNEFVNGHLFYSQTWDAFFKKLNMKQVFVMRDPRDVIVSYAYFIPTLKIHPLYETFQQEGFTHQDRMKFLIEGGQPITPKKPYQPNVDDWYTSFSRWTEQADVFSMRFEELVSSEKERLQLLHRLVKFLWGEEEVPFTRPVMVRKMIENINPETSPTYRKGKVGGWNQEFNEELKQLFKKHGGELLVSLQYEKNLDW
ncbi:sulfotransferase domain-containing protein [Alkalihalobacillus macyae]|uniref:sulfotransferase domain-containing protein n=1 Tax=Guptibacillus hwajinpoensis TaxID=208199 RepID=UPI00273BF26D|nr:sulfotransferase domain-containing protein [Alkalihalobacillus macyae]MDP4550832.1 sulfotransferase domain-containing protein [Alkalihalobacillus macyae]